MTAWLDLAATLLAATTVLLLSLDYAWRRFNFSMRRLLPWVVVGWIIIIVAVVALWSAWFRH